MQTPPITPGTILGGDFRLQQQIGAGAMGVVYVAEQLSTGSLRAVKLLQRELVADRSQLTRFLNEARIGARIPSDHVVQVLQAGQDERTGVPWLAMELLDGETLGARVRRDGRLPRGEIREVLAQLCHGLAAAHAVGIVHRDIKPENIFLCCARREGAQFTVKVLDFGISKLLTETTMSATQPMGTPLWMAPEQTDLSPVVGPPTDVWSLGLLTFWLLTGAQYWMTPHTKSVQVGAFLRELITDRIPPASERAAALGCAERIPPGFDAWFAVCLNRDPAARFPNVSEARRALTAVLPELGPGGSQAPSDRPGDPLARSAARRMLESRQGSPAGTGILEGSRPLPYDSTGLKSATEGAFSRSTHFKGSDLLSPSRPKRSGWLLAVPLLALLALFVLLVVVGGSAVVAYWAMRQKAAEPEPPTAVPSGSPEALERIDAEPLSIGVAESRPEPGAFMLEFHLSDLTSSRSRSLAEAGDQCRLRGGAFSLCSETQWKLACARSATLARRPSWVGTLRRDGTGLVCGGSGGCADCRPLRADSSSAARFAPCCTVAPVIRGLGPGQPEGRDLANLVYRLHYTRFAGGSMAMLFASPTDFYGARGITSDEAEALLLKMRERGPNDWAVEEECVAGPVAGPDTALDCRRTRRRGGEVASITTRIGVRNDRGILSVSSLQDTAESSRFAAPVR